ncbi:G2/mitotic-specific cyclin S13-7-like isoform X2 [Tasmannia lanceolata]|uniref:G2/mitotic-specific cyclin S13-7-like isoform X2 n=1 Tax=Tasmannia lanceolata TaxID=3420 RepID=UPI0040633B40
MASRVPVLEQARGGAVAEKQKPVTSGGNNRRALGDIGNVVNVNALGVEGKQQQPKITRPVTRGLRAQLLANGQADVVANKKSDGVVGKEGAKAAKQKQKVTVKPKPVTVIEISPDTIEEENKKPKSQINLGEGSSRKKGKATFTSLLTARSKVACGLSAKKVHDIDGADSEDQLAVADYVEDIYTFYRLAESSNQIHDYMDSQTEINEKMRAILMDWLIEVHNKFSLMPETLYLTVHIIDRYLSMETVLRRELQLVGVSAMLIASKYEEIWAPEISDFVCISDRAYTREQILGMEKKLLDKLEWSLTVPTPYVFLLRFLKAAASDEVMENMVFFFAELALMDYSMIMNCPSMVAASAVYVAHCTLKKSPLWNQTLKHHTGFSELQLMDCAKRLVKFHSYAAESKLKAVYKKYSTPECHTVASITPAVTLVEELEGCHLT